MRYAVAIGYPLRLYVERDRAVQEIERQDCRVTLSSEQAMRWGGLSMWRELREEEKPAAEVLTALGPRRRETARRRCCRPWHSVSPCGRASACRRRRGPPSSWERSRSCSPGFRSGFGLRLMGGTPWGRSWRE